LICGVGICHGIPVPPLNIGILCKSSDIVVAGRIGPFTKVDTTAVTIGSTTYTADVMEGTITVNAVLKGADAPSIKFKVLVLSLPGGSVGMDGIPVGAYRVVFLRKDGEEYRVTDSYHPSLPATSSIYPIGDEPADKVISIGCSVIGGSDIPSGDRLEAMWSVRQLDNPCIKPALHEAALRPEPEIKLTAEAELIARNDVVTLGTALPQILEPEERMPAYLRHNILFSVGTGVKDRAAIPFLAALMKKGDEETRAAAADALKNIGSQECFPLLVSALSDSSQQVRYTAVTALADINDVPAMHPSIPAFRDDEKKYLSYWQEWAIQMRK